MKAISFFAVQFGLILSILSSFSSLEAYGSGCAKPASQGPGRGATTTPPSPPAFKHQALGFVDANGNLNVLNPSGKFSTLVSPGVGGVQSAKFSKSLIGYKSEGNNAYSLKISAKSLWDTSAMGEGIQGSIRNVEHVGSHVVVLAAQEFLKGETFSIHKNLYVLDALTGERKWTTVGTPLQDLVENFAASSTHLVVITGSAKGRVVHTPTGLAIDEAGNANAYVFPIEGGGQAIWDTTTKGEEVRNYVVDSVISGDKVIFRRDEGKGKRDAYAYSLTDGSYLGSSLRWNIKCANHVAQIAASGDHLVLVDDTDKNAYVLNLSTNALWDTAAHRIGSIVEVSVSSKGIVFRVEEKKVQIIRGQEVNIINMEAYVYSLSGQKLWDTTESKLKGQIASVEMQDSKVVLIVKDEQALWNAYVMRFLDGAELWNSSAFGGPLQGNVQKGSLFGDQLALLSYDAGTGEDDRNVRVLDLAGKIEWAWNTRRFGSPIEGRVKSAALSLGENPVLLTQGNAYMRDGKTGAAMWDTRGSQSLVQGHVVQAVEIPKRLFLLTDDKNIVAIDSTDGEDREGTVHADPELDGHIVNLAASSSVVVALTESGTAYGLDPEDVSDELWNSSKAGAEVAGHVKSVAASNSVVVWVADDGAGHKNAYIRSPSKGDPLWDTTAVDAVKDSVVQASASDDWVALVTDKNGVRDVHVFQAMNGAFLWDSSNLGAPIQNQVQEAAVTDQFVFLSVGHNLFIRKPAHGQAVWDTTTAGHPVQDRISRWVAASGMAIVQTTGSQLNLASAQGTVFWTSGSIPKASGQILDFEVSNRGFGVLTGSSELTVYTLAGHLVLDTSQFLATLPAPVPQGIAGFRLSDERIVAWTTSLDALIFDWNGTLIWSSHAAHGASAGNAALSGHVVDAQVSGKHVALRTDGNNGYLLDLNGKEIISSEAIHGLKDEVLSLSISNEAIAIHFRTSKDKRNVCYGTIDSLVTKGSCHSTIGAGVFGEDHVDAVVVSDKTVAVLADAELSLFDVESGKLVWSSAQTGKIEGHSVGHAAGADILDAQVSNKRALFRTAKDVFVLDAAAGSHLWNSKDAAVGEVLNAALMPKDPLE